MLPTLVEKSCHEMLKKHVNGKLLQEMHTNIPYQGIFHSWWGRGGLAMGLSSPRVLRSRCRPWRISACSEVVALQVQGPQSPETEPTEMMMQHREGCGA